MSTSTPSRCSETGLTLLSSAEETRFMLHRSGETGPLSRLIEVLRKNGGEPVLSAWEPIPEAETLLRELRAAGLSPRGFFVPGPENAPWERPDLAGAPWPEPEEFPPPEYLFMPLSDTAENRLGAPGPFRGGRPAFVTIHNTAEPFSALDERARVENRRNSQLSFHFAVDELRIVQLLPLGLHGWHAGDGDGDGNLRSVGIEICRSAFRGGGGWLYRRAEANAVLLASALLEVLGLAADALRTHRDWSGKFCPHRILEEESWNSFVARTAGTTASGLAAGIAENA